MRLHAAESEKAAVEDERRRMGEELGAQRARVGDLTARLASLSDAKAKIEASAAETKNKMEVSFHCFHTKNGAVFALEPPLYSLLFLNLQNAAEPSV